MSNTQLVSVITPAYCAKETIGRTVLSVLAQTYAHWEMLIVSDDGGDYEAMLGDLVESGIRAFAFSTGGVATGESHARNTGLEAVRGEAVAVLDADDTFLPQKLERCVPMLEHAPVVTCALEIVNEQGKCLRYAGTGISGLVTARQYRTHNFSSETMPVFDRTMFDLRYDETLLCNADHDFLLHCFEKTAHFYHIGVPLQCYYKQPGSVSNSGNAHLRFHEAKQKILHRLKTGYYHFVDADANAVLQRFYTISQRAETEYEAILKMDPTALFEDVIEPMLRE